MTWTIFVTLWIVFQAATRAVKQPKQCKLEGKSEAQLVGGIIGCILWGGCNDWLPVYGRFIHMTTTFSRGALI